MGFWRNALRPAIKKLLPVLGILVISLIGVGVYNFFFPAPVPPSQSEIDDSIQQAIASVTPEAAYSSEVYQIILPSLVFIQIEGENAEGEAGFGLGSGVIVNEVGDILTAHHVIAGATKIEVNFSDGSQSAAEVIAAEPGNDIAVLRPEQPPELIVPAVLASLAGMRVGDEAYAVGNPLGLTASMSAGVISGFNRSIPVDLGGQNRLDGLIQFDTAVNPGSSGGPLLNRQGQVIGIVTALANPAEQNFFVGIGFAVPIGTAVSAAGGPGY